MTVILSMRGHVCTTWAIDVFNIVSHIILDLNNSHKMQINTYSIKAYWLSLFDINIVHLFTYWKYTESMWLISHVRQGCFNGNRSVVRSSLTQWSNPQRAQVKSSPLSAAYMRQWTRTALVQVIACRLLSPKPLPEPILDYCWLDSRQKKFSEIRIEILSFHYKMHLKLSFTKLVVILSRGRWVNPSVSNINKA